MAKLQRPQSGSPILEITPQPAQWRFLSSTADITIYGGSAGSGKSYAILLEAIRHIRNPHFGAVIFHCLAGV